MNDSPASDKSLGRIIYRVAIVAAFAGGAWVRFSLPLEPGADPDTWGYLWPAVSRLAGEDFVHEGRNFLYPGFVWVILRLFGDFRAIAIGQHLLGLAAGLLLLLTWRRARVFVRDSAIGFGHDVIGIFALAIFLFAGEPLLAERQIRPEGVCAFFLTANLFCVTGFVVRAFVATRPPVGFGIGVIVTALILVSLKPSFVLLGLVSVMPVAVFLFRGNRLSQKLVLLGAAVVSSGLLLVPEYFLSRKDDKMRSFLPTTLFVVHADLIRDQLAEDIQSGAHLPYPREQLERIQKKLAAEISRSAAAKPDEYFSLGFSPDYLMFEPDSAAQQVAQEFSYDVESVTGFYRFSYGRAWRRRPLAMVRKVVRQMAIFYAPICPAYYRQKFLSLPVMYERSASSLEAVSDSDVWKAYSPAADYLKQVRNLAASAPLFEQSKALRIALNFLAGAHLPLLAATLSLGVATLFNRGYRKRLGWLVWLTLFVFSYNVAACLEVAVIHCLEVLRYTLVQFSFTLLAEFLAIWLVCETIWGLRGTTRPKLSDPMGPAHPDLGAG